MAELPHREVRRGSSRNHRAVLAAALVLVVVASVAIVAATRSDSDRSSIGVASSSLRLTEVPQGVSVQQFGHRLAFVVRDGERIRAFDTNVHHLRGEHTLWWCPTEQVFVAPTHAETFSRAGRAIGGPATSGLDRLDVAVRRETLVLASKRSTPGTPGNVHTADATTAARSSWDSGPGSFCAGALKAGNGAPTTILHVEALSTIKFDEPAYDVPAGLIDVRLAGATGITFTFDDHRYRYCLLATDRGAPHSCRVYLTPGDYLVYDSVPGHRQAGYEATIRVADATAAPPSKSTIPTCADAAGLALDGRDGVRVPTTRGTIWALPFASSPPKVSDSLKVVWRVTGSGPLEVTFRNPAGKRIPLTAGPTRHLSSTFLEPGAEYGTVFEFGERGCYTIDLARGKTRAKVGVAIS